MKRIAKVLLSGVVLFSVVGTVKPAAVQAAGVISLSVSAGVSNWVMDEQRGLIYAVSGSNLLFINKQDVTVKKTLPISQSSTDLDQSGNRLFIDEGGKVEVVDLDSQTIVQSFYVNGNEIAVDGNKVFSVGDNQWTSVGVYDLTTGQSDSLKQQVYEPDLAVDPVRHILYVGEYGLTGSNLYTFDTTTGQEVGHSTYDQSYGFSFPKKKVYVEGDSVYYAGRRFNADNVAEIYGEYNGTEAVTYVEGNYVFTNTAIYDKDHYEKLAELPVDGGLTLADSQGMLYFYDPMARSIKKGPLNVTQPANDGGQIGYTDWVLDEPNGLIHAISTKTNKLYEIRMSDSKVIRETLIGSQPTDIELCKGKLYIADFGSTEVAVVDAKTGDVEKPITVMANPNSIETDGNKMFYTGIDQWQPIYEYDMQFGGNKRVDFQSGSSNNTFYSPDLYLDRQHGMLYIGESGISGGSLTEYNISDMSQVGNFNGYGYGYPTRKVSGFGDDVYYAGDRFKEKQVVFNQQVSAYGDTILNADGPYVFGAKGIYDRDTGKSLVQYPFTATMAAMDSRGIVYLTAEGSGKVYKFILSDPSKLWAYEPTDIGSVYSKDMLQDFVSADLLKGYPGTDGTYTVNPNGNITRAEFAALVVRALGLQSDKPGKNFVDVPQNAWYADTIRVASSLGIINGVDSTHFEPNRPVQRDEAAALIVNAFASTISGKGTPKPFRDVPNYWATDKISMASALGIINGFQDGTFGPRKSITRGDSVVMIHNALQKQDTSLPNDDTLIQAAINNEIDPFNHMKAGDFDALTADNEKYTTGYEYALDTYSVEQMKDVVARNYTLDFEMTGTFSGTVVHKSNGFAEVQLSGVSYQVTKSRDDFSQTSQSGPETVYLKKDPDTNIWKVYKTEEQ